MKSEMHRLLAKVPAVVRDQVALERRTFESEKHALVAAREFFGRHTAEGIGIALTSRLCASLIKRTVFVLWQGEVRFGPAVVEVLP